MKKTSEGTVFSSEKEKRRAHMTRMSDTLCMIGGHSDDERKTRVHLMSGSRKTLMSTVAALVLVTMAIKGAVDQRVFGRGVSIRTSQS